MKKLVKNKNVLVVFGGRSVEHDISIITGVQTLNALDKSKYNVLPLYISKEGKWLTSESFFNIKSFSNNKNLILDKNVKQVLIGQDGYLYMLKGKKYIKNLKIDFAFLSTHGGEGEDGSLQGLLSICSIPFSSTDVFSSAMCMNKLATKNILVQNGIEVTNYESISQVEYNENNYQDKLKNLSFPLLVKPCNLGSSIGITYCKSKNQLKNALSFAFLFDNVVLIEEAVENLKEVNIAIMGNSLNCESSDIEEVMLNKEFLTFENKYMNKDSSAKGMENASRIIPAELSIETKEKITEIGKKAFSLLNCCGIVRIDFLINSKTNNIYLNEVNAIPGSLSNYLWKTKGYSFKTLLDKIMQYSLEEFENKKGKIKNFSTNVLAQFDNASKLKLSK